VLLIDHLVAAAVVAVVLLFILEVLARVLRRFLSSTGLGAAFERSLIDRLLGPMRLVAVSIGEAIVVENERIIPDVERAIEHGIVIVLVIACSWMAIRGTYVLQDLVLGRYRVDGADNLRARRIQTQLHVLRRLTVVVVVVVAISVILLSFARVRAAGEGLLASAGLIGVVVGIAAQGSVTNLIAGIQIAISQPIRVDDVVVVQGHWGRVEEINLNYVVVRIWDLRRLILPVAVLVSEPFENWTRNTADILEWVHLELDYRAPIPVLREHLHEVLLASPNWDGVVWSLQVTTAGPSTIQVRALMSARDSSSGWDLQCAVREELIDFLQRNYPDSLPRIRFERGDPGGSAPVASPSSR
jgi:small-conductance mechanosensitive channel